MLVARHELLDRQDDARAGVEQRQSEIDVIVHPRRRGAAGKILNLVADREAGLARSPSSGNCCGRPPSARRRSASSAARHSRSKGAWVAGPIVPAPRAGPPRLPRIDRNMAISARRALEGWKPADAQEDAMESETTPTEEDVDYAAMVDALSWMLM
jgi:hypothetical protein